MEQPPQDTAGRGWTWVFWGFGIPLLYVLSIGPVGALTKNGSNAALIRVRGIYYPVIWLHDHTPLKKPLEAYASVWGWH